MALYQDITQLIGNTPLLELKRIKDSCGFGATVYAKLECFNPASSAKDRAALFMILDAEERGLIKPGAVLIEPTSGNTGIALSSIASSRGYRCIIVMPDSMSVERRNLIQAYGAQIVLTPGSQGMPGAIAKAEELQKETPNSFIPGQFINKANVRAHYHTTGPEIWRDLNGKVDCFVAGVGTGGTISGAGAYLKEQNPSVTLAAVEPSKSPVLSGGAKGPHAIQGIGAGFIPEIMNRELVDEVIQVQDHDAFSTSKLMRQTEGILVGISSGAALWAALSLAARPEYNGKNIVVLLPDTGERYLTVPGFLEGRKD